jgi:chromosome partitioning protein
MEVTMRKLAYSAIKGGVGKSSLAILTSNYLARCGYRVLIIDADPQNSTTFYYLPDTRTEKSLAAILGKGIGQKEDVLENIVETDIEGVHIIPSALELFLLRNCDTNILTNALSDVNGYDYCVIDTSPNFDNVVVNAVLAADLLITPVQLTAFDLKSTVFYSALLQETGKLDDWRIVLNKFKPIRSGGSIAGQILSMFESNFRDIMLSSRIPDTTLFRNYINSAESITRAKSKAQSFSAMERFVEEIAGIGSAADEVAAF